MTATAPPRTGRRPAAAVGRMVRGRAGRAALSGLVVVAIFGGVLPRMTSYTQVWGLIRGLGWPQTVTLLALAAANLGSYALLWMAAVPGLRWWRATLVEQAATAVSNTIPVGWVFGAGTSVTIYHSLGYPAGTVTRAIGLTGIWNNLVKLAVPVVALTGLALTGEVHRDLLVGAGLGIGLLLVVLAVLVLGLTHGDAAAALAAIAERLAGWFTRLAHRPSPSGWPARMERFRTDSLEILRLRWRHLTVAAVASHLALFALLLACVRLVGDAGTGVSWLGVLSVFSVTRLVTIVPITPGALGVAELSYVAGLTALGTSPGAAGAAVLVFRFLTWFLPIPSGTVAWLLLRRNGRGSRGRKTLAPATDDDHAASGRSPVSVVTVVPPAPEAPLAGRSSGDRARTATPTMSTTMPSRVNASVVPGSGSGSPNPTTPRK